MSLKLRYGLFAFAVYLAFLVGDLPASTVYPWLKAHTAFPAELYQLSGTVWNGRAAALRLGNASFEQAAWRFRPQAALLGRMEYALAMNKGQGRLAAIAGRGLDGSLYIRDVDLRLGLEDFADLAGYPQTGLQGQVTAKLPRIALRAHRLSGIEGTVELANAALGPPANVALGGFSLRLETTAQGMRGVLKDTGGPLQADGVLTLQPDGNYRLNANLGVRDPTRSDLAQALKFMGPPGPGGRVVVNYNGRIPLERLGDR
jgi:hypothetical protein